MICVAQVQPTKHGLDHADYTGPVQQRELLDHTRSENRYAWKDLDVLDHESGIDCSDVKYRGMLRHYFEY